MKPTLTRFASGFDEPEHTDEKWATGTRMYKWARNENGALFKCYYTRNPPLKGLHGED